MALEDYYLSKEQFRIECRETKTNVITLANRNRCKQQQQQQQQQQNQPANHLTNTSTWRQAWENACGENTISFGLDSHWLLTNHRV